MTRRTRIPAGLAAAALLLTGCGLSMPHSGPVHDTNTSGSSREEQPSDIDPPPPAKGASQEDVVAGFLDAMTATPPIRTSVAREFLSKGASASWKPTGMVIYNNILSPRSTTPLQVETKLIDAKQIDARGAWLGPLADSESTIKFPMVIENGEYRIAEPPAFLLVPQAWFQQRFKPVSLYFFDPSATMLIPEPVFVPRGRQFASTLVNALLQGPAPELAGSEQSYLPADLRSLVAVPVSAGGVAQVDLTSDTQDAPMPSSAQAELLVSQLAWTLQQDPTISRFRVTIDDRPLQLPGESEFSVEHGHQYAPYVAGASTQLFGLRAGLMVQGSPQNLAPVTGPFGRPGYALRTVSPDLHGEEVAGVSAGGDALYLGPVKDNGQQADTLLTGGEDLLRPAWDFSGRLWEIDRRSSGAVVSYLNDDKNPRMVPLDVPGISGQDVKHFLVSRDGSRLIAVIRQSAETDSIVVSRILTNSDGDVARAQAADDITDPDNPLGQVRDLTWASPTSMSVLTPLSRNLFQVRTVSVDGANPFDAIPVTVSGRVANLVGIPVPNETTYVFEPAEPDAASAALVDLGGPQSNQMDIDPRITFLTYAG